MSQSSTRFGILVGIDGSPESLAAVRWAARAAALRRRPVTLMHVVSPIIVSWSIEAVLSDYQGWQEDNADNVIKLAKETLCAAVDGSPAPEVLVERRHDGVMTELTEASGSADLIVIGSRGLGPVGGAVLGSVSRGLLHHARCPLVVTKDGVVRNTDRDLPVLLGVDGSPSSEAAIGFAFAEASRRGVDLVALHAWSDDALFPFLGMDWHTFEDQGHEILGERLAGWQEQYPDVTVYRRIVCDKPARWLIDESRHAQLVVVGSRGRGGISGMLLGSVSTAVAESASAPVAVVRA
ncbi:universal stress protein [Mycobacterium sp. ITM-2016-00316]|uniref:universal stress protein n=1 Tax=Mycobacterium sp. ITM-2016-00316 TaxID=2099695 RepID=UPI000CF91F77|nr:universal stress protein [Mycobacterium sp. ITM-2016-00316]WNG83079.1 universal stress protein [Mycobacterium sp. ITM-2016-00316]